jgi:WD40-like Beta Propeller Repeat
VAVQPWQLETSPDPRPLGRLELVKPPPSRPSAVIAVAFIVLIVGLLGSPALKASLETEAGQRWSSRPQLPGTMELDSFPSLVGADLPRSDQPAGGLVFVSCTRLWTSGVDGSHRRLIVEMPGLSSPTFSPDGRTIAFLADGDAGQSLWLASADGADRMHVADITIGGERPQARATALTWGARPDKLAFALVSNFYDEWSGGSAIVSLQLDEGEFRNAGSGWPVPSWTDRGLMVSRWMDGSGPRLDAHERVRAPTGGTPLSGRQTHHTTWWTTPSKAVSVVESGGVAHLELRRTWRSRAYDRIDAPTGTAIDTHARPALSEDGTKVIATLIDGRDDERDVGVYDVRSGAWTVLDYAWEADVSSVPTSHGTLSQRRARSLADAVFSYWGSRPQLAQTLMSEPDDIELLPMRWVGWMPSSETKIKGGWEMVATAYGPSPNGFAYRPITVAVVKDRSRMIAEIEPRGPVTYLRTIDDAVTLLAETMGSDFVAPVGLPAGTKLARFPVDLWSWNGNTTGYLRMVLPGGTRMDAAYGNLSYSYGHEISLSFGCGGTNDPEETRVGDQSALTDRLAGTSAIVWPATLENERTASFGVSGKLSKSEVLDLATKLESARR